MKKEPTGRGYLDLTPEELVPGSVGFEGLFLGRFTRSALERELESAGILAALGQRGFEGITIETDLVEGEHRLRVLPKDGEQSLVELRVSEATCPVDDPVMRAHGLEVLYLLTVHWLTLQNPRAAFTPDRPCLPGQTFPGLGFGRRLYGRLMTWAHDWGKDALLNFPEYFHNAVFYATLFRFLSPRRQGRFEALRRDLASLHVAAASTAVEEGRVIEESSGSVWEWQGGEMVAPVTRSLRDYLDSADYRKAVEEARASVRFSLAPRVA
jgi:hypothetical protein